MNFTNKMAEVTLIDFSYLNILVLSTFTEGGPQFSNQESGWAYAVTEKAKNISTSQYPRSISVTLAILISEVPPCLTPSRFSILQVILSGDWSL